MRWLPPFTISVVSHRIHLTELLILSFALLVLGPAGKSQTAAAEKNDGLISGSVYGQDSKHPATQVAVTIKSSEAGVFRSVLTDYAGHFEISGLARGSYEIQVEEEGYEPAETSARVDGQPSQVELHLVPTLRAKVPANAYRISVRELSIPQNAHEEFNKGLLSLGKKDFGASLGHFTKAIQKFPGYFEAFYHQGIIHTTMGQLEKAMQSFQKCMDLSGGQYARAHFGIGYLLYLEGKPAEAEGIIRRGLEVDADAADGYVVLGMTLLRLNRPAEAEKSARAALLRDPNQANAYLVLADSFARRQNYAEQIQDLDSYLRLEPIGPATKRVQEVRAVAIAAVRLVN